jgi:hypothetical protein
LALGTRGLGGGGRGGRGLGICRFRGARKGRAKRSGLLWFSRANGPESYQPGPTAQVGGLIDTERAEGPFHRSGMGHPYRPGASRCSAPGYRLGPRWGRTGWEEASAWSERSGLLSYLRNGAPLQGFGDWCIGDLGRWPRLVWGAPLALGNAWVRWEAGVVGEVWPSVVFEARSKRSGLLCSRGPTARNHTSLGQRPR